MLYRLVYNKEVHKDVSKISPNLRKRIIAAISKKLTTKPNLYGKPLRQSLTGYRSLRIYKYRVIFKISKNTVYIEAIAHRSLVYVEALNRLS